jgi:dGTP triphosphohydrolase
MTRAKKAAASTLLAPYAADEAHSRGRIHPEPKPAFRSEYQRDRDRIIHSNAFRRLVSTAPVLPIRSKWPRLHVPLPWRCA